MLQHMSILAKSCWREGRRAEVCGTRRCHCSGLRQWLWGYLCNWVGHKAPNQHSHLTSSLTLLTHEPCIRSYRKAVGLRVMLYIRVKHPEAHMPRTLYQGHVWAYWGVIALRLWSTQEKQKWSGEKRHSDACWRQSKTCPDTCLLYYFEPANPC